MCMHRVVVSVKHPSLFPPCVLACRKRQGMYKGQHTGESCWLFACRRRLLHRFYTLFASRGIVNVPSVINSCDGNGKMIKWCMIWGAQRLSRWALCFPCVNKSLKVCVFQNTTSSCVKQIDGWWECVEP